MASLTLANEYTIKSLTMDSLKAIERLNQECSDYYLLHERELPSEKQALAILNELPPGKHYEDKYSLGVFNDINELIGMIDIVRDFPVAGEWMLGLLLIKPKERNHGLGRKIHDALVRWAITLGATSFRIGVIEDNYKGKKFWTDLGYMKTKEAVLKTEQKTNIVNVMNFPIGTPE